MIVKAFIQYMYCDCVDTTQLIGEDCCDLLRVAHMYEVHGLKNTCEKHLNTTLTEDNVVLRLLFSVTYHCVMLKAECVKFLRKNIHVIRDDLEAYAAIGFELCLEILSSEAI